MRTRTTNRKPAWWLGAALAAGLLLVGQSGMAQAGQCLTGGCTFQATPFGSAFSTTSSTFVPAQGGTWGGEYNIFNVTSGIQYEWSLCPGDGAISPTTDSQLTLFNTSGTALCYSDDLCGAQAKILWTSTITGQVFVQINQFFCGTNTNNHTMVWRQAGAAPPPAGCTNTTAYGSAAAPTTPGQSVTINTCTFQNEYNTVTGVAAATTYISTYSLGGYITVRSGTFNGPTVAAGNSPLTWLSTVAGPYYIHYNTNAACGTASSCGTTTIARPLTGCNNTSPFGTATAPAPGVTTTISTCTFQSEYNTINSCVAGQTYVSNYLLSGSPSGFITVRSGTSGGPIVASGNAPLTWTAVNGGAHFVHYNTNSACGTLTSCGTSTIQALQPACTNTSAFGTAAAPPQGTTTTISTCTYQSEYNTITGCVAGQQYVSTMSLGGYISVRSGTPAGPLVAAGNNPLTWTANVAGTHYIHYTTNSSCGQAFSCGTTTIFATTPITACTAVNIPSVPVSNQSVVCHPGNLITGTNAPVCGGATTSYLGGWEAVYTFTPTETGSYEIFYTGQSWTAIWVWSGSCPTQGGTCVASVSNSGIGVTLVVTLNAGTQYWIVFDTWPSPQSPCPGTFSIGAPQPPPPPGVCLQPTAYGTITAPSPCQTSTIGCIFAGQYGTVLSVVAGAQYTASSTIGTDHFTVRQGTPGGAVIAYGPSPLNWTATVSGTYYVHVSSNAACATQIACRDLAVTRASLPIVATATVIDNCLAGTYNVQVLVTETGGSASANIVYSIDGGANITIPNTVNATIPNIPVSSEVSISVNNGQAGCLPVDLGTFDSNCPITIQCGDPALQISYCYKNNDTKNWTFYPSSLDESLTITFLSGTMAPGAVIRTYVGTNNLGIPLGIFANYPVLNNVTTTGLVGQPIYMEVDNLGGMMSCQSGDADTWLFQVRCTPSCDDPLGNTTILPAVCGPNTFTIGVEVEYTGAYDFGVINDFTTVYWTVNGNPGGSIGGLMDFDYVVIPATGGFPLGSSVDVYLENEGDSQCNRLIGAGLSLPTDLCFPNTPCLAQSIPLNTSCVNSVVTLTGATPSGVASPGCASFNNCPDVWYTVTVPTNGIVRAQTSAFAGGITDSGMAFYTGASCGSLSLLSCNDDFGGLFSYIQATGLTPGSTLYIRLWRYGCGLQGNNSMNLCVWTDPACSPNATPLAATNITQTTASANFTPPPAAQAPGCVYVMRLTDSFGDGWNGAVLNLRQGTTVLQSFGPTFTTGAGPVDIPVSVPLSAGTQYNLSWSSGGSFQTECGFQLLFNGTAQYTWAQGQIIPIGTNVHTWTSTCSNIPNPATVIVEYGPVATFTTPGTGATAGPGGTVISTTSSPVALTGLTPNTQYRYFVRRNCSASGDGFAANSSQILFTTLPPPPANDECSGATTVPVNPDLACTLVAPGTLLGATSSAPAAPCLGTANDDVWFTFTTTSENHQITYLNVAPFATLYTQFFVGDNCGALIPLGCLTATTINLTGATPGLVLYFRTYSSGATNVATNFNVCVRTLPPAPPNDLCANAIPISCNSTVQGTTLNAFTVGAPATTCGTTLNTAPGVWYTVQGWNGPMTATLCGGAGWDTKIGVFTGSCAGLVCVAGNDDFCGLQSQVSWAANANTTYIIYVTGFGAATGNFDLTVNCVSTSPACQANGLQLELQTDAFGSQISWQIVRLANSVVLCSGQNLPNNTTVFANCCLPNDCYDLRVFDSAGDGIIEGGYVLRTQLTGNRIIDNSYNFNASYNGFLSTVSDQQGFCLPIGTDKVIDAHCDKADWVVGFNMQAVENPLVSAQWQVGDQMASGYEFWIFDPNGSYSFRKFRPHGETDGFGPPSALRATNVRLNNFLDIPWEKLLNIRVRSRVMGMDSEWGPACRMVINPSAGSCPATKLEPAAGNQFSCGVTRTIDQFVYAQSVSGANAYEFRFRLPSENFTTVKFSTTNALQLNWTGADALIVGATYNVEVRARKGQNWCVSGPLWGDICTVTIVPGVNGGGVNIAMEGNNGGLEMWPNPNNGDQLWLSLDGIADDVLTMSVDIFDLTGKRVTARIVPVQDGVVSTVLDLNGDLAAGMYMVNITAGDKVYTERLVIQP